MGDRYIEKKTLIVRGMNLSDIVRDIQIEVPRGSSQQLLKIVLVGKVTIDADGVVILETP